MMNKAVQSGVTHFEQMDKYFDENFDVLKPVFLEWRKCPAEFTERKSIINLHDAYLRELKESFSDRLDKDRMYKKAAGFVTDQQIWLIGILCKYFMRQVMHFNHEDFLTACRVDLGPILGEIGLWFLKQYEQRCADKGKDDKKKKARCAQDLI